MHFGRITIRRTGFSACPSQVASRGTRDARSARPYRQAEKPVLRPGFTLIEIVIVISIMVLLASLVVAVYGANLGADRMRAAARQWQSALLAARDRAIHAKAPRGIRLVLDANDPTTVTGCEYIAPLPPWSQATVITLGRPDLDNDGNANDDGSTDAMGNPSPTTITAGGETYYEDDVRTLRGFGTGWYELKQQGLLVDGSRIRLPASGSWYTVNTRRLTSPADPQILEITSDYRSTGSIAPFPAAASTVAFNGNGSYLLELQPAPLPGESPLSISGSVVIDLDHSRIPAGWRNGTSYARHMDILFSPRGTITGPLAAQGILHFLLAERADAARQLPPESSPGEKLAVTLFTRTGAVSTHPIDASAALGPDGAAGIAGVDDDSNGRTDLDPETNLPDPGELGAGDDAIRQRFRLAETGAAAGQ